MLHALDIGEGDGSTGGRTLDDLAGGKDRFGRIRCPKCRWRPRREDRWACEPDCAHVWNTFDTGGVCPKCGLAWEWTMCLACQRWSRHSEWYE